MARANLTARDAAVVDEVRELLRSLAAAQSLDLDDRLDALEDRLVTRIASAVVDELDRRGWTVAAPTTECVHCEGTGWDPETTPGGAGETCWQCGGRGQE